MPKTSSKKTSKQVDGKQGFVPVATLLRDVYADLEKRAGEPIEIAGMTTGFKPLDERTDGLHKGELIVIGARPSGLPETIS